MSINKKSTANHIDFVVSWVDGGDLEWQISKQKHNPKQKQATDHRYRDWDNLRYLFRGIEEYAPWVRKIHFVTAGHLPDWLDTTNPKLNIVKHSDYIPAEYLPTFSSRPIELNLHRIKGLSEQFVYYNDDTFILKSMKPTDFFTDGLPCDQASLQPVLSSDYADEFPHTLLNVVGVINKNFSIRKVIKQNPQQWFSLRYPPLVLARNLLLSPYSYFTGFATYHLPSPLLKSTLKDVWKAEPAILKETSSHKFRKHNDVNQYVFRAWQFATGNFHPTRISRHKHTYVNLTENFDLALQVIRGQYDPLVCINDTGDVPNFNTAKKELIEAFDSILPDKSSFEA